MIRDFDLVHARAGVDGHDIARPAEFLVDRNRVVRWRHLTDDYRVRVTPQTLIDAARSLR